MNHLLPVGWTAATGDSWPPLPVAIAASPSPPRSIHGTPEERDNWKLIGSGEGIHWPDLDEDLSIEGFLAGRKSGEGQRSFKRWLEAKQAGLPVNIYEIRPAAAEDV